MAMVNVLNWQPTGGLIVQADRLGPKVGGHLAPCCTHRVNQGELSQSCFKHDDNTIKIVLALLLLLLLLLLFTSHRSLTWTPGSAFAASTCWWTCRSSCTCSTCGASCSSLSCNMCIVSRAASLSSYKRNDVVIGLN